MRVEPSNEESNLKLKFRTLTIWCLTMNSEIGVMKIMKEMCFRALRLAEFSIHNKNIL